MIILFIYFYLKGNYVRNEGMMDIFKAISMWRSGGEISRHGQCFETKESTNSSKLLLWSKDRDRMWHYGVDQLQAGKNQ